MGTAGETPAPDHAEPFSADLALPLLRALADPIRLQVVQELAAGERCVCELTAALALAQSRLSFHLKGLKQAGLISSRQQGRWIYYSLRPQALERLQSWLGQLATDCGQAAPPCP